MLQLILHLFGDYVLQSQSMAEHKTKRSVAAGAHALCYSIPFLLAPLAINSVDAWFGYNPSAPFECTWLAFSVILGTHFVIDRFALAKRVVWAKNWLLDPGTWIGTQWDIVEDWDKDAKQAVRLSWRNCKQTGYPQDVPVWMAVWLTIAADNTLHLAINWMALRWL